MRSINPTSLCLLLCLVSTCSASSLLAQEAAEETAKIIVTGNTGGVSSWHWRLGEHRLLRAQTDEDVEPVFTGIGAATDGTSYLLGSESLNSDALKVFLESKKTQKPIGEFELLWTDLSVIVRKVGAPPLAPELQANVRRSEVWTASELRVNDRQSPVLWLQPKAKASTDPGTLSQDLSTWEVRFSAAVKPKDRPELAYVVTRVWNEGTRRVQAIKNIRSDASGTNTGVLYVDAGNALDGYSFLESKGLSLQRANDWDALKESGLDILAPSQHELLEGLGGLRREAAARQITLISANIHAKAEKAHAFKPYVIREVGDMKVAVTAIQDPNLTFRLPQKIADSLEFKAPGAELTKVLNQIATESPDMVVVVTTMPPAEVGEAASAFKNVDLVVTHHAPASYEGRELTAIRLGRTSRKRAPVLSPSTWGGQLSSLNLSRKGDEIKVRVRQTSVDESWPRHEELAKKVLAVRHRVYAGTDEVVIPDLAELANLAPSTAKAIQSSQPGAKLPTLNEKLWQQIAANSIRKATDSDIALIGPLPYRFRVKGATRELYLMSYLAVPDTLVRLEVPGNKIGDLLKRVHDSGREVTFSGYDQGSAKIDGREINPDRYYTLSATDELVGALGLDKDNSLSPRRRFKEHDGWEQEATLRAGRPATLKHTVSKVLRFASKENDPELWAELLTPPSPELTPRWFLWVRNLSLSTSRNERMGPVATFSAAQNPRATTADFFELVSAADISLLRESSSLTWDTRVSAAFGRIELDQETQETQDDLVLQTDFQANALQLTAPGASVNIVPYTTLRYDTEFTAQEDAEGIRLPQQRLGSSTLGLLFKSKSFVKEWRIGAVGEADFAADNSVEVGAESSLLMSTEFGGTKFATTMSALYFLPSEDDDITDLGMTFGIRPSLSSQLLGRLQWGVFLDYFAFRGKLPETKTWGSSLILGAEVKYNEVIPF